MDDTRNVAENCQADVDEQVRTTSTLEEDTKRREDDGEDNLADVTASSKKQLAVNWMG